MICHPPLLRALILILTTLHALPSSADSIASSPILFVTAVPNPNDFGTFAATFGNHLTTPTSAYRGGDLWIRYPDGTLKNLTSTAGYGNSGFQGASAIAVRDPTVHWDGTKAIFSMVIGAPTQQYQLTTSRWQLYEITGLGASDTPVITKVPHQPANYNNIAPAYSSDDHIVFVSDHPRDSTVLHTYPQRDEYESSPVNTGIWKLNPTTGTFVILDHSPSGDFNPIVDSFGRIVFTRWDHLQRDQQNYGVNRGAFNYESETSTTQTASRLEVFPEPRTTVDPAYQSHLNTFTLNQFFPWAMHQDGTDLETLNHIGRQEIGVYSERSFNNDPNIQEFYGQYTTGANQNEFTIFLHLKESPTTSGLYLGTNCQEFGTHSAGQILSITGAPGVNPDAMMVTYLTHPTTAGATDSPSGDHSGLYRDPLPLSNGNIIASHTSETRQDSNTGSASNPGSRYAFRLKLLTKPGPYYVASTPLTSGLTKSISFWSPDSLISYNGPLWELMPVEVKSRPRPPSTTLGLPSVESGVLQQMGVGLSELTDYLKATNLALVVSRNVTSRDKNDRQQPYNLRIFGTDTKSVPKSGTIYDIARLQFFQGDLIRGYSSSNTGGRRVIATPMHSVDSGINRPIEGVDGSMVALASDGSMAAFVPARRALTWQLTDNQGTPVVRERYWVTFQPGEVRVCASCHGVNTADHLGNTAPTNPPLALAQLLAHWKNLPMPTPTPTPNSGGNGSGGYTLTTAKKGKKGSTITITAKGGNKNDRLTLGVSLNGERCTQTKKFTRGSTTRKLRGQYPALPYSTITYSLSLHGNTNILTTTEVSFRSTSKRKSKKIFAAACRSLIRALR